MYRLFVSVVSLSSTDYIHCTKVPDASRETFRGQSVMTTEKFKALVHYVAASCDDPHRLGATRLNKICWFSDSIAYRLNGVSMTGETYVKRQRGPVSKTILATVRELESEGKLHVREQRFSTYKMRMFVALTEPDKSLFSDVDLEIVNAVMNDVCDNHTANSISDLTHDQIWAAANEGEEIPLFATLAAQDGELTDEISAWADSVVQRVESKREAATA